MSVHVTAAFKLNSKYCHKLNKFLSWFVNTITTFKLHIGHLNDLKKLLSNFVIVCLAS